MSMRCFGAGQTPIMTLYTLHQLVVQIVHTFLFALGTLGARLVFDYDGVLPASPLIHTRDACLLPRSTGLYIQASCFPGLFGAHPLFACHLDVERM